MSFKRVLDLLSHTNVFVYGCVWLLVLVVVGTLVQPEYGLYYAQQHYFSSWFTLVGGVLPLPGGRLTLAVIFVNLLLLLLVRTRWEWRKAGIIIMHIGGLLLLVGGFLTAYFGQESNLVLAEGETSAVVQLHHGLELAVIDQSPADHDQVTAFAEGWFKPGEVLQVEGLPGRIEVLAFYENCSATRRSGEAEADLRGLLRRFDVVGIPAVNNEDENRRALLLRLSGMGAATDGRYVVLEGMGEPQRFEAGGKPYALDLRGKREVLPFALELIDFEKKVHPGTGVARSYKSVVNLIENGSKQRVVIYMNHPLRHRGYTLYQSSFIEGPNRETTVLAVVKNYGRLFPYISSLIMCIGLLVHLLIQLPRLFRARTVQRRDA